MKGLTIAVLLLGASCGRAGWVEDLLPRLRCGMSLDQVRQLTDRAVEPTSTMPWLGSYRVDGERADVWLDFEDDRLVSVITGKIDGLSSVRLSPKENLCTGELAFRLNLVLLSRELLGAAVYLDGRQVASMDEIRQDIEVSDGVHDVRIELEGFLPFVTKLERGPGDLGEQRLEIRADGERLTAALVG